MPVGQVGEAHVVPAAYFWQAPAPSQTPFCPQDIAPWSLHICCGSAPPTGTLVHIPAVAAETLHDLQVPVQLVVQQTPWLQNSPAWHSAALPQVRPGPLRPHDPLAQVAGVWQSLSVVQAAAHAPVPHMYG
jgi:hypothetical protein